jgi:hypothetical protein
MHSATLSLHWPSEVLLDAHLEDLAVLRRQPVVILSDVQCLSDAAVTALTAYVRGGGVLIATGETGTLDEWGVARARPALDDLFGVTGRVSDEEFLVLEDLAPHLTGDGLPPRYMISGRGRILSVDESREGKAKGLRILARTHATRDILEWTPRGRQPADGGFHAEGVAVVERRLGRGVAVLATGNIGWTYSENPNPRTRLFLDRLVRHYRQPPYEVDAPWNVAVTLWKQGGDLVAHVLNQPATCLELIDEMKPSQPDDVTPTGPVRIRVAQKLRSVRSPTVGAKPRLRRSKTGSELILPRVEMHAVLVCATK